MAELNHNLSAMILAAGLGTRMRPYNREVPKALVKLAGRPLVHFPLMWLRHFGIHEVVLNSHYMAEALENKLGEGHALGMKIRYSREQELQGTGGGLALAAHRYGMGRTLLTNADTVTDLDLLAMLDSHLKSGASATMAVVPKPEGSRYTTLLSDGGFVKKIGDRPQVIKGQGSMSEVVFAGVSILEPAVIDRLPHDRPACLVKDGIIPAMESGEKIGAYLHRGYWKAIDDEARLKEAEADIEDGVFGPLGM